MMHWLNKKDMTEEDIKLQFITPAIQKNGGWTVSPWKQKFSLQTEK